MAQLEELVGKIQEEIGNENSISVILLGQELDLDLNLGEGFQGYEHVSITREQEKFDVNYFGIFPQAFKTFLDEGNEQRIGESAILSAFRKAAASAKKTGVVERYDTRKQETYSQIFNLDERGHTYQDAEKAVLFFLDVFKKKAYNQREPAG